jgi:hypothetical protein
MRLRPGTLGNMNELAKAALTLAGGKALEIGAEFLKRITGPKADELGKEWAARKTERILTVASQADAIVMDLPLQMPPDRVLIPLLNGAGNEDDAGLQTKWATLLAHSAMNPDKVLPSYPRLLSELSPVEAQMLDRLYDSRHEPEGNFLSGLATHYSLDSGYALTLVSNLDRLGLVGMTYLPTQILTSSIEHSSVRVIATPLAISFVEACRVI